MIFTLKHIALMLVVSHSPEKINVTVFDANITPYEHTSLYPSHRCLYSLALPVGASSELKKAVCFVETQEGFFQLPGCAFALFVLKWFCAFVSSVWYCSSVRACVCVCVAACVNNFLSV